MKTFKIGDRDISCQYSFLTEVIYKKEFGDALRTDISMAEKTFNDCGIDLENGTTAEERKKNIIKQISELNKEDYKIIMDALNEQFEIFIQILYATALSTKSINESYYDFISSISPEDLTPEFMAEIAEFVKSGISPKARGKQSNAPFRK